jgi:cyanophycinase
VCGTLIGAAAGTLILTGGGFGPGVAERFGALAGADAHIIYIPSASSGIRLPSGFTWIPPEQPDGTHNDAAFAIEIAKLLHVGSAEILHSRERRFWDSDETAARIGRTRAIWISGGNAGRLADLMLGTKAEAALKRVYASGGVIGGESAGSIVIGSFIVRGRPDKPVLMAAGHERGFGILPNVAIDPHLAESKRENELIQVVDAHPELLGIGIDEPAAIVVSGTRFEVIGEGLVAIYDNLLHGKSWYYDLPAGSRFDLATRRQIR